MRASQIDQHVPQGKIIRSGEENRPSVRLTGLLHRSRKDKGLICLFLLSESPSLAVCAAPAHELPLLIARDNAVSHLKDIVDAAMVGSNVSPDRSVDLAAVHQSDLSLAGAVADRGLVGCAQCSHLMGEGAAGHWIWGAGIGEAQVEGVGHCH